VIDPVFIQVEPAAADALCPEFIFCYVRHIAGVAGPVGAAVDQQDIERCTVIGKRGILCIMEKFSGRTAAFRTSFRRVLAGHDIVAY